MARQNGGEGLVCIKFHAQSFLNPWEEGLGNAAFSSLMCTLNQGRVSMRMMLRIGPPSYNILARS